MKLNDLDLNKVRIFLYVYRALSVRGAAKALHLTPAAVSMSLKSFEQAIGVPLFTRVGRHLIATTHADQLAALATPFFTDLDRTLQSWRQGVGTMRGHLKLGLPGEFGSKVVMPLIAEFRALHPAVTFTALIREPQGLMPELMSGRLDVVICDDGAYLKRFPQISHTAIAKENLVLACSSEFYDRDVRGNHDFSHIRTLAHVAYVESQEDLHKWYQHHFGKKPKLLVTVVADNPHAVLSAVKCGLGLGMLPAKMIADDLHSRALRIVETKKKALVNEMLAIRLKDKMTTGVERSFLTKLKERAKST